MIEQFIAGRELTCGVLGDEALVPGEIFPQGEIFRLPEQVPERRGDGDLPGGPAAGDRGGNAAAGAAGASRAQADGLQPVGLPAGRRGTVVVPGSQHPAGNDGDEFAAAIGGGGGDFVRGTVRADRQAGCGGEGAEEGVSGRRNQIGKMGEASGASSKLGRLEKPACFARRLRRMISLQREDSSRPS